MTDGNTRIEGLELPAGGARKGGRKAYRAPQIMHEVEMETRAGSPLFVTDPATGQLQNPWDPDFARFEP
jgi:hypothetical protein